MVYLSENIVHSLIRGHVGTHLGRLRLVVRSKASNRLGHA